MFQRFRHLVFFSALLLNQGSMAQAPAWGMAVAPRPDSQTLAMSVPIADVHLHYSPRMTPAYLLRLMAENNVRWGGGVGDYDPAVQAALGDRYLPAIGQAEFARVLLRDGQDALLNPEHPIFVRFFQEAESLLGSGKARGFGEIHISNLNAVGSDKPFQRKIPLDSPVVRRMYELADAHAGFVQIHYDKDRETVDQIIAMAQRYPRSLTIVSHCLSRGVPADMQRIFKAVPNVMCELSGATYIHGVERIVTPVGMRAGWLELVEEFPERVMLGTDPCCGLVSRYGEIVLAMRAKVLATMRPETLELVAYKNALRVFGLEPLR